jgi:DNA-binding Lrp family transcriptional regulator
MNAREQLDAIDQSVIGCLRRNARSTYAQIGAQVGLSAPAVKRRCDRLVAIGAIRGFTAVIDPEALGWETEAYVEVMCRGTVLPSELRRQFELIPEVVSACTISGPADALLHVLARDVQHLESAVQMIRAIPEVASTRSEIVLSRLIDRHRA